MSDLCAVCGKPPHQHSGGTPNYCRIVPTYRPVAPLAVSDAAATKADIDAAVAMAYESGRDTALREVARLRAENVALRHWAVNHIDALLLYAAGSYPNDSHVKEAVEFCRIVAPSKKLRMDSPVPLSGSGFHPARAALEPQARGE